MSKVTMEQMTLFDKPHSEFDALWKSVIELKDSHNKVRKRLFSEVGELRKELVSVRAENERLKFYTEEKPLMKWIG